jgi:hypothetical protein
LLCLDGKAATVESDRQDCLFKLPNRALRASSDPGDIPCFPATALLISTTGEGVVGGGGCGDVIQPGSSPGIASASICRSLAIFPKAIDTDSQHISSGEKVPAILLTIKRKFSRHHASGSENRAVVYPRDLPDGEDK